MQRRGPWAEDEPTGERRAVFRDPALDEAFRRDGYVTVPFLSGAEVDSVLARFQELNRSQRDGFVADAELDDIGYKAAVFESLVGAYSAKIDELLDGYAPFLANYITKEPGEGSELSMHQDWNFVDESRFQCAFVWVPLVDVSAEADNGPIYMVPGCHLLATLRGGGRLVPMWPGLGDTLAAAGLPSTDVRAGEAIVWDPAVPHYSGPNRSAAGRPVTLVALAPEEAPLSYCYGAPGSAVVRAEVEARTFIEHSMPSLATGVPDEMVTEPVPEGDALTADQMIQQCLALGLIDDRAFGGDTADEAPQGVGPDAPAPHRPLWRRVAGRVRRAASR
jgi:hypothetical protein